MKRQSRTRIDASKCSVDKKWQRETFATCYDKDSLLELIAGYNRVNKDDMIKYTGGMSTDQLWNQLESKMFEKYNCQEEWCWINQDLVKVLNYDIQKKLKKNIFLPPRPKGKYSWLSSLDILDVMQQYEKKYPDFKFYGPYPRDFQNFLNIYTDMKNFNIANEFVRGIRQIAFVFNLDKQNGPGTHWTALFINLKTQPFSIEYFDSVGNTEKGNKVPKEFKKFMLDCVCDFEASGSVRFPVMRIKNPGFSGGQKKCPLQVNDFIDVVRGTAALNLDTVLKVKFNTIQHQQKNSECGVYAINFIVERVNGKTFEDISKHIVRDDEMNTRRDKYFRPAKN